MILLTNGLSETADEGSLKVACSLASRIRSAAPDTCIVTYERASPLSDCHLSLNKLLLDPKLAALVRGRKEPLLYIPTPAKSRAFALRLFVLSRFARYGLRAVSVMAFPVDRLSRMLLRASGAEIIALSHCSWERYREAVGSRAVYIKTGVDTRRFSPAAPEEKAALRKKYGLPEDKIIVFHAGHLNEGRGVGLLARLDDRFHGLLALSTQTASERDPVLGRKLKERPNVTILDSWLPHIEELYRLSDVYLFPVEQEEKCIDVPLSVLEAAACGLPVVTTAYGELASLTGREGFYLLGPEDLNGQLARAAAEGRSPRQSVMEYDWEAAVRRLLSERIEEVCQ